MPKQQFKRRNLVAGFCLPEKESAKILKHYFVFVPVHGPLKEDF